MMLLALFTLLIVLVSTVALSLRTCGNNRRSFSGRIPPGGKGWPIIGEYLSFAKSHPASTLGPFMEDHISRYGKIFTANLFGQPTIISADAELNNFILNNDNKLFSQGYPKHFEELASSNAIILVKGDDHKRQRSFIISFFAGNSLGVHIFSYANELAAELVSSWKPNSVVSAKEAAIKFTFDISVKRGLGWASRAPEVATLLKEFENYVAGLFCFPIKFPGTQYWKALKASRNIEKALKDEMDKRAQNSQNAKSNSEQDDLMSLLINEGTHTAKEILNLTRDAIGASYMSTSRIIPVVIYYLGNSPKVLHHLREEHLELIQQKRQRGEDKLTWDDCKQLKFTHCVINECLRLGMVPILLKKSKSDIEYKDYVIPRGWTIITHIVAMHLDPLMYEEPEKFNPWRCLGSSGLKITKNFIPFSRGARQCPGSELTKLETIVFLHHLIIKYNWTLVTSDYPINSTHFSFNKGLLIKLQEWSQ